MNNNILKRHIIEYKICTEEIKLNYFENAVKGIIEKLEIISHILSKEEAKKKRLRKKILVVKDDSLLQIELKETLNNIGKYDFEMIKLSKIHNNLISTNLLLSQSDLNKHGKIKASYQLEKD